MIKGSLYIGALGKIYKLGSCDSNFVNKLQDYPIQLIYQADYVFSNTPDGWVFHKIRNAFLDNVVYNSFDHIIDEISYQFNTSVIELRRVKQVNLNTREAINKLIIEMRNNRDAYYRS